MYTSTRYASNTSYTMCTSTSYTSYTSHTSYTSPTFPRVSLLQLLLGQLQLLISLIDRDRRVRLPYMVYSACHHASMPLMLAERLPRHPTQPHRQHELPLMLEAHALRRKSSGKR